MLAEIDKEKEQVKSESLSFVQNLQKEKIKVEQKMDKLLDLFIEGKGISPEEYQAKKSKMLNEKLDIEQKIRDFEQKGNNWLEPMKEMILESSQAKILLSQSDKTEIRQFLKNVGSNFILKDKKFNFAPKIGWIVLLNTLAEGEPATSFSNWRCVFEKSEPISLTGSAGGIPPNPLSARLALKRKRKGRFQVFLIRLCRIARLCRAWRQIILFYFFLDSIYQLIWFS